MTLPPQKFREIVFQLLYSDDMGFSLEKDTIEMIMEELKVTRKNVLLGKERAIGIKEKMHEIDTLIGQTAISYEFERIQSVERNILRLGIYELLYDASIPPVVAISEAVRLAKKFGTPESTSFVNAILDAAYKRSRGEDVDAANLKEKVENLKQREQMIEQLQEKPVEE